MRLEVTRWNPKATEAQLAAVAHAFAFARAAKAVERWLQRNSPNEVGILFAENTDQNSEAIKAVHHGYHWTPNHEVEPYPFDVFHSNNIIETVHFVAKWEAAPLVIGDACAFLIRRRLSGKTDSMSLYRELEPYIILDAGRPVTPPPATSMGLPDESRNCRSETQAVTQARSGAEKHR